MFRLKPEPLLEEDVDQMELLFWKWQKQYGVRYDEAAKMSGKEPPEIFKDWFEEFDDWIKFMESNFEKSLPQYVSMTLPQQ